jgi:hypothetical protein
VKDRDQKQIALKYAVASRWLPQLEVDVSPVGALASSATLVTDLDVLASIPDRFVGFQTAVFDCKTGRRESAVNRSIWLAGILDRMKAQQGFCILKNQNIALDHRLMANKIRVIVLDEKEFELYAEATCEGFGRINSAVENMANWETLFNLTMRYPKLESALRFTRSHYWMIEDSAESCRKTIAGLRAVQPELDPSKPEHVALFLEFCTLFARSLAVLACELFKAYLHPSTKEQLSEPLLIRMYGGREAYEYRNTLFRMLKSEATTDGEKELALPEWERFVQLVRQVLESPRQAQDVPLLLRETGFAYLESGGASAFAKTLALESKHSPKFGMLVADYMRRAAKIPSDFTKITDNLLLSLIEIR